MMLGVISRLWSMSLQAGVLILVVLAVRFFLSKYPKVYTYFLWMLVGIRLLCPVFVETPFSLQPETLRPEGIVQNGGNFEKQGFLFTGQTLGDQGTQAGLSGKEDTNSGSLPGEPVSPTESNVNGTFPAAPERESGINHPGQMSFLNDREREEESNKPDFFHKIFDSTAFGSEGIFGLLAFIYLSGTGICVLFYMTQYLVMRHRISTAVRGKENVWFSEKIASPFVLGIIRPRIIMPYGLKKQEGYQILRHEQTHIRHHDPLVRLAGTLCICLHWWNPLVWLAVFRMNQDMEMFCDETVLRDASPEEKKSYAQTLLSFAEKRSGLSVGLAFGESHTERRVRNLAGKRKGGIVITSLVMTMSVFCVAAFMTIPAMDAEGADTGMDNPGSENRGANGVQTGGVDGNHAGSSDTAGNMQNMPAAGNISVTLTQEDKEYLIDLCPKIPDFAAGSEMDTVFWREFLFNYYTSDFDRETADRYVEEWGYEVSYVKVSQKEVQDTVEQIFGSPLSAQVEEELSQGPSVFLENGFYYISVSDSPDYKYEYVGDTDTDILKEVELLEGLNGEEDYYSQVHLFLIPADNERGFIITGKDRLPVLQDTESGMIKEQSFDVEFHPHGQVTFAAYAPNTELTPGEDVAFKLIQDGQVIYTFGGSDSGRDRSIWKFQNVAAVAFPDLNGDGYTDVVTLVNYKSAFSESTISEARIYTGREGRYFIEEAFLQEAYNNSHDQKTITDVENFVSQPDYQDYYMRTSIYGRWKVTEHISSTGISALSQEEIESFENTQLEYGMYWYKQGSNDPCTVDHYRKETVTSGVFEEDFSTSVSAMGISAAEFDYYELEGVPDSSSLFGQFFYQIDADNALVYYEGVFFRAIRE